MKPGLFLFLGDPRQTKAFEGMLLGLFKDIKYTDETLFEPESNTISIDFETFYTEDDYSAGERGIWHYCNDPRFDAYLVSASDGKKTWVGHPKNFNWKSLEGRTAVSHNSAFDVPVYSRLVQLGIVPLFKPTAWHCTMNLAAFLGSERNLKSASKMLLGKEMSKEIRSRMSGKFWMDAVNLGFAKDLVEYGRIDAQNCWEIWNKHQHLWPEFERQLSQLTIRQSLRGACLDIQKVDEHIPRIGKLLWEAQQRLPSVMQDEIDKGKTGLSPKLVAEACRRDNIDMPIYRGDDIRKKGKIVLSEDSEDCEEWEEKYSEKFPWVAAIRDARKLGGIKKSLSHMSRKVRPDNCMGFSLKYFGAGPGRWTSEGGFSMQILPKETRYGVDLRSLIIPRPGYKFIICDLSQIEPRVLLWLVGDKKMLSMIASGYGIYDAHAELTMGWPKEKGSLKDYQKKALNDLKDRERSCVSNYSETDLARFIFDDNTPRIYKLSKGRVIGLGYGCGPDKFVKVAKKMAGLEITIEESKKNVADFRQKNPGIFQFHKDLQRDMSRCVGHTFSIELPSGRFLRYKNIAQRMGDKGWMEYTGESIGEGGIYAARGLYGGKLCENAVQAIARDVFAHGMLKVQNETGYEVVFHAHDEVICEAPIDDMEALPKIKKAMTTCPDWLKGCPLGCDIEEAPFYKK